VTTIRNANPSFQFYAFTNLPQLTAPGWIVIVKSLLGIDVSSTNPNGLSFWHGNTSQSKPVVLFCVLMGIMKHLSSIPMPIEDLLKR